MRDNKIPPELENFYSSRLKDKQDWIVKHKAMEETDNINKKLTPEILSDLKSKKHEIEKKHQLNKEKIQNFYNLVSGEKFVKPKEYLGNEYIGETDQKNLPHVIVFITYQS